MAVTSPNRRLPTAWWATRWMLKRAGAEAVRITPAQGYPGERFDGFVIGGGNDIDPAIYSGDIREASDVDPQRDQFELAVLALADRIGVPVLGICRGAQLINVHRGGNLYGDLRRLRRHTSNRGFVCPRKPVRVAGRSWLRKASGRRTLRVNSLHHQAVDRLGRDLVVTARDNDDIVQAIESRARPIRIGTQWHPEYLPQLPSQRQIFRRFTEACRRRRAILVDRT